VLDVVYNHAGGFDGDDQSVYFWDRARDDDNNQVAGSKSSTATSTTTG